MDKNINFIISESSDVIRGMYKIPNLEEECSEILGLLIKNYKTLMCYVESYTFINESEEINFFKNIKPNLYGNILFLNEISLMNLEMRNKSDNQFIDYMSNKTIEIKKFFEKYKDIYYYYLKDCTLHDSIYFRRNKITPLEEIRQIKNDTNLLFSTYYDDVLANIISNEHLFKYIEEKTNELKEIDDLKGKIGPSVNKFILKWTGTKIELIELVYALHSSGVINNNNTTLNELFESFELIFDIDIKKYSREFISMKNRIKDRTKFLTSLNNRLIERMDKE